MANPLQQYSILSQIAARQAEQQQQDQQFKINLMMKLAEQKRQTALDDLQKRKLEHELAPNTLLTEQLAKQTSTAAQQEQFLKSSEERAQEGGYREAMKAYGETNIPQSQAEDTTIDVLGPVNTTTEGISPLYGSEGTTAKSSKFQTIMNQFNAEKQQRTQNLYPFAKEVGRDFGAEGAQRIFGMGEKDASSLKPNERYHVMADQGQVIDLAGEDGPTVIDVPGLLAKSKPEDKDKIYKTLYTQYSMNLESGQFDKPLFAQLMKASDDPMMRDIIVRQTARKLIAERREGEAPDIVEEYKAKKQQEDLAGVTISVMTHNNADGTSTASLVEVDKKNDSVKTLKSVTGSAANVPEGSINKAREHLTLIDENLKRIDDIDTQLRPSTTGWGPAITRWGESKFSMLNNTSQEPSQDVKDTVVKKALAEQAGLRATRTETGVQRSEAEMERIIKAYGLGEIPYWEARIQLQILQNNLLFQQKLQKDIVDRKKYEPYVPRRTPAAEYQDKDITPSGKVIPRKPGESISDYLKRIKQ